MEQILTIKVIDTVEIDIGALALGYAENYFDMQKAHRPSIFVYVKKAIEQDWGYQITEETAYIVTDAVKEWIKDSIN